ncbi:hypothetical protein F5Y19DRAFT_488457 [Xylariaceae sp. FL1651]|nr:hypothetical protein F5Y19DRAFT_488457 [Xylariaceae sp. FL1651]
MVLGGIVGLIAVLPYGVLVDRTRKPTYLLAATGQFANIAWPLLVKLVLLGSVLELIGSGLTVAIVVPFRESPPASRFIGTWSPWVSISLSLVITTFAGAVILLVPERAINSKQSLRVGGPWIEVQNQEWCSSIKSRLSSVFESSELFSVLKRRLVILLLITFKFAAPLPMGIGPILFRGYIKRFGKLIEDAGYMLVIRGGLTIVVVGAILPALSKFTSSSSSYMKLQPFRRYLILAQASAMFACLGYFLLG